MILSDLRPELRMTDLELELCVLEFAEDPDLERLMRQRARLLDAVCVSEEARVRRDETLAVVEKWIQRAEKRAAE